jgi:hypothetical protein
MLDSPFRFDNVSCEDVVEAEEEVAVDPVPEGSDGDGDGDGDGSDGDGGPRVARSRSWGPFSIAQIFRTVGGAKVAFGWGAVCGRHNDVGDSRQCCKKQVTYGKNNARPDEECKRLVKMWLLKGVTISNDLEDSRSMHLAVDPKKLDLLSTVELDRRLASLALPLP